MGISGVHNDIPITKVSDQASASAVPAGQTSAQASADVHEANLRQALEVAGQHLQQLLSTLKDQAPSINFAGPPLKDAALDTAKMNLPNPSQLPGDLSDEQALQLQQKASDYSQMMQMISNILKMLESTSNSIVQNLR